MTITECVLPIVLLVLIFTFKLFIDRRVSWADFIITFLDFPTSVLFVGISFVIAFTISSGEDVGIGLIVFVIYLAGTALVVFFSRRAVTYFENHRSILSGSLGFLSYAICVPAIFYSVKMVVTGI